MSRIEEVLISGVQRLRAYLPFSTKYYYLASFIKKNAMKIIPDELEEEIEEVSDYIVKADSVFMRKTILIAKFNSSFFPHKTFTLARCSFDKEMDGIKSWFSASFVEEEEPLFFIPVISKHKLDSITFWYIVEPEELPELKVDFTPQEENIYSFSIELLDVKNYIDVVMSFSYFLSFVLNAKNLNKMFSFLHELWKEEKIDESFFFEHGEIYLYASEESKKVLHSFLVKFFEYMRDITDFLSDILAGEEA